METRVLEIRKSILNENDDIARDLRYRLLGLTINFVSSPGTGKTTLRMLCTVRDERFAAAFKSIHIAVIAKLYLAEACEFDMEAARSNIEAVSLGTRIIATSAKTGLGVTEWLACLVERKRMRCATS